jgi:hypothetical protein
MFTKVVTRSFQLRHVSVVAATVVRESFDTASWNTAGIEQSPSCNAHVLYVEE